MRRILPIAVFALFLCACGPARKVLSEETTTRVIINERQVLVPYIARVDIPLIRDEARVLDTTSFLENRYSLSKATVRRDGTLEHTLETKPQTLEAKGEIPVTVRDSIVYVDREVVTETVKEVERGLTRWQRFCIDAFFPLCGVILLLIGIVILFIKL